MKPDRYIHFQETDISDMNKINSILGDPTDFLSRIFKHLRNDGVDVSQLELDHICYRVSSTARYFDLKSALQNTGELLTESQVSGRSIASIKLHEPILFQERKIHVLELPSPKKNSDYPEGFEHVEFVIDRSFDGFMQLYPGVQFDVKSASKAVNPEIRIQYGELSVKFHHHTLEYVIKYLD